MTTNEHLAAARANLAPALRNVRRDPAVSALSNVIAAVDKLEDSVQALSKQAPKAAPLKRVPLGKAAK